MNKVVECNRLTKQYKNQIVINDLSLSVRSGEKVMLLGENGAGKTTLLRLLLGLEEPTSGTVKLNEEHPKNPKARINIGVTPQESDFIDELTGLETIKFIRAHHKETFSIPQLIKFFLLDNFINKKTVELSLGQKRRLALAIAFLNKPSIIFLDEPTVGLDVESRREIWSFISEYTNNNTVTLFLTTHYLEEAEMLTKRIIHMQEGKIVSDSSKEIFKENFSQTKIKFHCDRDFKLPDSITREASRIESDRNYYTIFCKNSDQIIRNLVQLNVPFYQLQIFPPSLEEAFISWQNKEIKC